MFDVGNTMSYFFAIGLVESCGEEERGVIRDGTR